MGQWLTRPLQRLADGARLLFQTSGNHDLPETGTREVRMLASAVNELQHRIRKLVDERTHMLAAVSHDLRTPLTRLRLRITNIGDGKLRRTIETDLNEMEDMIEATLAFLRDDSSNEEVEPVDLMAILETIRADASDAGEQVDIEGPRQLVVIGRHLALKRALTNLIQNAVKYGGLARVRATQDDDNVMIFVEDEGPGLPLDQHEAVFQPFVRSEPSRSRSTGGHGLGLTMARSVVRSHGGEVSLANREAGGLKVTVRLPCG
jgi:signal transduction histidine kinase